MNVIVLLIKVGDLKLPEGISRGVHEYQLSRIEQWDATPPDWSVAGVFTTSEKCLEATEALAKEYENYNVTFSQTVAFLDKT